MSSQYKTDWFNSFLRKNGDIMKIKDCDKIHKDFKGVVNGVRYVLVYDEKHGTISVPINSFVAGKYSVGVLWTI